MVELTKFPDEDFTFDSPLPFRDDLLGLGQNYVNSCTGQKAATLDDVCEGLFMVEEAVHGLNESVAAQFDAHDYSLRAEVEKVNTRIAWLLGAVGLAAVVTLVWPRRN